MAPPPSSRISCSHRSCSPAPRRQAPTSAWIFKMSDVIGMVPATSFGACVAGTFYEGDIYREGETDWKDAELNPIIGTGTDDAPLDDHVAIFLTGNPAAVEARGVSENQVVLLHSD